MSDVFSDTQSEAIKKMYDNSHKLWQLFDRLSIEDIELIDNLITVVTIGDTKVGASFYEGFLRGYLYSRDGVCPTCKVEHHISDTSHFQKAFEEKMKQVYGQQAIDKARSAMSQSSQAGQAPKPSMPAQAGQYL